MRTALLLSAFLCGESNATLQKYPCGQEKKVIRSYGKVTEKVSCNPGDTYLAVEEFKSNKLHGHSMRFHKVGGWKKDSTFYLNGVQSGTRLSWDSSGLVIRINKYRNGRLFGKQEGFSGPGKPKFVFNYDSTGEKDGPQSEWWENGNKKSETMDKKGQVISGTEYYPNGKPRVTYVTVYNPKRGVFGTRYVSASSWAPNGRPTGSVVKGNGDFMLWEAEPEEPFVVHQEFYKDSNLVTVKTLDSAQVEGWFKGQGKPK